MKTISLTLGLETIVDDDVYEALSDRNWHAQPSRQTHYAVRSIKGQQMRMHRLIIDAPKGMLVDHIDRNGLNNLRSNLRLVTVQQNTWNRVQKNVSTGYIGVRKTTADGWYASYIGGGRPGERRHIKSSRNPIECARAYDEVCKAERGEYAVLNFPG